MLRNSFWNFSFKFDVESCPMPRLDSRPLEIRIDSIGLFHWTLFAGDIKMSIMVCSVVCFSQAMNQDKRDTATCVGYLSQVMA